MARLTLITYFLYQIGLQIRPKPCLGISTTQYLFVITCFIVFNLYLGQMPISLRQIYAQIT